MRMLACVDSRNSRSPAFVPHSAPDEYFHARRWVPKQMLHGKFRNRIRSDRELEILILPKLLRHHLQIYIEFQQVALMRFFRSIRYTHRGWKSLSGKPPASSQYAEECDVRPVSFSPPPCRKAAPAGLLDFEFQQRSIESRGLLGLLPLLVFQSLAAPLSNSETSAAN